MEPMHFSRYTISDGRQEDFEEQNSSFTFGRPTAKRVALTDHQKDALSEIRAWVHNGMKYVFWLAGLAGTGKTSIIPYISDFFLGNILYVAYTGKAVKVLSGKLGTLAYTIHSSIYKPVGGTNESEIEQVQDRIESLIDVPGKKTELEALFSKLRRLEKENELCFTRAKTPRIDGAKLVIVDEASMVGRKLFNDLCSHNVPVLMVGDPGQLPPVKDNVDDPIFPEKPNFTLTEILRQKGESQIIRIAHDIRERGYIHLRSWRGVRGDNEVIVMPYANVDIEFLSFFDQILSAVHVTRMRINREMREYLGYGDDPLPKRGDRLICCKNDLKRGLINGGEAQVEEVLEQTDEGLLVKIKYEGRPRILTISETLLRKEYGEKIARGDGGWPFKYSYCLTVHKAQGSEWERVAYIHPRYLRDEHRSSLPYTAVTRAKSQIAVFY